MTLRNLTFGGAAVLALATLTFTHAAVSAPATPVRVAVATQPALSLDKVTNPAALVKMRVENSEGAFGTVVDVVMRSDGKPVAVTIDTSPLYGGKRHWIGIDATKLGYDQNRRVLVSSMTNIEIKALPSLL